MPNRFKIHGLDCAEEVAILKREIGPLVGGPDFLAFDVLNGVMTLLPGATTPETASVIKTVAATGMRAELVNAETPKQPARTDRRILFTSVSGALTFAGTLTDNKILYALAIIAGVYLVLPKAWFSLRRARPDMNLLMTIAVIGAVAIGEWSEGATVAFLFALSLALESWSVGRARHAVEKLLDLTPAVVHVRHTGHDHDMPPATVQPGAIFLVKPGERIPLDGEVVSGTSDVNQAPITGESLPVAKRPGATVFAGTVNGHGSLDVRSTKPADDTTLAHIIRLVSDAQNKRAPSEQWVDRFAYYYTPTVMFLAIAVALIPPLTFHQPFAHWFYQALVLLVIACPCALVISTPVSVVAALASAARNGVLVKGGSYLEAPAKLKAIAMDKTGTLTAGHAAVARVVTLNGHTETELVERAAAMEAHSDHPLARAILAYAHQQNVHYTPAEDFRILPGQGASAKFDGRQFWLGSHRFLEERGQETPEVHEEIERLSQAGHSVVVIGNDAHVCGFFALADQLRPESKPTIAKLKQAGIETIVMLTGDNHATASVIAEQSGITAFQAELLPQDKVKAIEKLVEKYGTVAMIGDGINDAPAMALATLGIAMGAAGSDAAIEAADIALMSDDLTKLPWLINHSRRMLRIIRANIVLSLAVKAAFVGLTLAGHASLWAAIAADMGVSLLVIANALRLLRI